MKKEELMALGLDTETIKQIQKIHGNDMQRYKEKIEMGGAIDLAKLRGAIINMIPMLNERESLRRILSDITYLYYKETKTRMAKEREREDVSYYIECEKCGAKLDPGEKCNCEWQNENAETMTEDKKEEESK